MEVNTKIDDVIKLREEGHNEKAAAILLEFVREYPHNPLVNYRLACVLDYLGRENEAVDYYETAIANGLEGEHLQSAFLGLGSTYRCLGLYHKSIEVFNEAVECFPEDRTLQVFRALTLYNLGRNTEAVSSLLTQLVDTTGDKEIKSYRGALRFYADKLDQVWK